MDDKTREEIALKRFSLISPVVNGWEGNAEAYFRMVCEEPIDMPHYGIREYSPKTIRCWMNAYKRFGFDALKPGFRSDRGKSRKMTPELEKEIADRLKEFPRMKGSVLYDQLVEHGKLIPANLSRSTFYRYLASNPQLTAPGEEYVDKTERFSYRYINELWQTSCEQGGHDPFWQGRLN